MRSAPGATLRKSGVELVECCDDPRLAMLRRGRVGEGAETVGAAGFEPGERAVGDVHSDRSPNSMSAVVALPFGTNRMHPHFFGSEP
jgi:hypothetical protein